MKGHLKFKIVVDILIFQELYELCDVNLHGSKVRKGCTKNSPISPTSPPFFCPCFPL